MSLKGDGERSVVGMGTIEMLLGEALVGAIDGNKILIQVASDDEVAFGVVVLERFQSLDCASSAAAKAPPLSAGTIPQELPSHGNTVPYTTMDGGREAPVREVRMCWRTVTRLHGLCESNCLGPTSPAKTLTADILVDCPDTVHNRTAPSRGRRYAFPVSLGLRMLLRTPRRRRTMTKPNLSEWFTDKMLAEYYKWRLTLPKGSHRGIRFKGMLTRFKGVGTAKRLMGSKTNRQRAEGYGIEELVADPRFRSLFTKEEVKEAKYRLTL